MPRPAARSASLARQELARSRPALLRPPSRKGLDNKFDGNHIVAIRIVGNREVQKTIGNWVVGEDFFDRETEIEALTERVQGGTHTLITAQRRMGKTSVVRELLRRLAVEGRWKTIFVDLESVATPAEAIAEIWLQAGELAGVWGRFRRVVANTIPADVSLKAKGVEVAAKLRAGINAGNWRHKGDHVFRTLAREGPTVLAIDELAILTNKLIKGDDYRVTPDRVRLAGDLLAWLRKNGQEHQGKVIMILLGSVSLEPILEQAGLSAHANIFAPFDLKPWDDETALECLGALAATHRLELPLVVREAMCKRLRCQIPHHVQRFFDVLHEYLRRDCPTTASLEDVEHVYRTGMLGIRGQMDMPHYENRLKMVLGTEACRVALEMLAEAATNGLLSDDAIAQRRSHTDDADSVNQVLRVLEHDGYLERQGHGYGFVSGLLEDWWRVRYGMSQPLSSSQRGGSLRSAKR